MKQGSHYCYHCKKKFRAEKRLGRIILLLTVSVLLIIINIFLFNSAGELNQGEFLIIVCLDMAVITVSVLVLPLTVRLIPEKITKSEKKSVKGQKKARNMIDGK